MAGFAVPTLVAVPALGILARLLGPENFGLFTLAFALIGYASIFDAGISRAVIREISLYRESEKEQIQIISTASVIVLFLGVVAALLLYFSSNKVVELLNVSSVYIETAVRAFS
ncbi:TPA: O4 family O-antigen flippase, partial [Escherichia coli]